MSNGILPIDYAEDAEHFAPEPDVVAAPAPAPAMPIDAASEPKRRGRPPKAAEAPKIAVGREPARSAPRSEPLGDGLARARDGTILTRRGGREGTDQFAIPPEVIPSGWTYQWNAISVHNDTDVVADRLFGFYSNGWRPVPADRHPGLFVKNAHGDIVRGGLRLEERPASLTREARQEQISYAKRQLQTQNESVMGSMNRALPQGFATPTAAQQERAFGRATQMRMSIDPALDIAVPGHEIAE